MNWLNVALWGVPIVILIIICEIHLSAKYLPPPPVPHKVLMKPKRKPSNNAFTDSVIIGAVTDSAIIGGVVGGDIGGGLIGKTFRDLLRRPHQDLG